MDWISVAVAAVCGGIGGALGWLAGAAIKQKNVRAIVTVAVAILVGRLGTVFLTPYVEIEYLFANPSPEFQAVIRMAPDHVDELKARLLETYRNGGTEADFERVGALWAHTYAGSRFIELLASQNDSLAAGSFDRYMAAFKTTYTHNRVACYDWFEGTRIPSNEELGFGPADVANLEALMANVPLLSKPGDGPAARTPLDPVLQKTVLDNVRRNWDAAQLDFDAVAKPSAALATGRKVKGCYTGFALMSEIQRLPLPDRLRYLRSLFGAAIPPK